MEPNFLNKYVEPYLFAIFSAIVTLIIASITAHLNNTFGGSRTILTSIWIVLLFLWIMMVWVNYSSMTVGTLFSMIMAVIMMVSVYMFLLFEWLGKGCPEDTGVWAMVRSVI